LDIVDTSPAGNASQAGLSAPGLVSAPITEGPDKNGYFRMPDAPNGEYTFWPNTPEKERYGSRALIDTIYTVAMEWAKKHPEEKLVIGDMNVPPPNRHLSHRTGIDVDIYTKASTGDANKSGSFVSNEDKAVQLGKMFADTKNVFAVYYNVIKVQQEVNPYANNVAGHAPYQRPTAMMFTQAHHFNHFHVRIPTKFKGPDVAR
jgi:murein endopeptidase